jgi:hypothetical protein
VTQLGNPTFDLLLGERTVERPKRRLIEEVEEAKAYRDKERERVLGINTNSYKTT